MELDRIEIKNFRSIKYVKIRFEHNCLILLGKNEAGKSNALKAMAALFGEYPLTSKDKRKKINNEKIDEYFIRGVFKLTDYDIIEVEKRIKAQYANFELIQFANNKGISDFIKTFFDELLIKLDIVDGAKPNFLCWAKEIDGFTLKENLCLTGNAISKETPGKPKFILQNSVLEIVKKMFIENPFKCHYWKYSEDFLLPQSVNIAQFIANPTSNFALRNIFELCSRDKIKEEFDNALVEDGDYSNLFEQVSKSVSKTFQKIWDDFKETEIQLIPNGSELLIKVVNKAKYSFEDRSDGFKKFISILLMLSSPSRVNKIAEKDLILIDEPDQSLYPTSAEYLRNELLEISKKSKIVYSTHSQYMIDSNCLQRHLIVEKKNDITTITKETGNAPFSEDELLRRAIGASVFGCLKSKNILFEGWLDYQLFIKYCEFEKIENVYSDYGKVYLGGISGVETLVQLLMLANKKFVIVADSDSASNSKKQEFIKNYPEFKDSWLSYSDAVSNISTMEDFLISDYIGSKIMDCGINDFIYNTGKNAISNIEKAVNNDKDKKQEIKNLLIKDLSKNNILDSYELFVNRILKKITDL